VEIEVIVREEHVAQALEIGGLVALQPEDLGGGEAGQELEAGLLDHVLVAAEFLGEQLALFDGAGIAPELGGADDEAFFVEGHEAVLLAGDADAADAAGIDEGDDLLDDGVHGVGPVLRVLLHVADGQAADELVRGACLRDDFLLLKVEDDGLGALGAGIDADIEGHVNGWSKR